ncbi:MAG: dynamin family protein [Clostridia bacterium]
MTYTQLKKETVELIDKSAKLTRQLKFDSTAVKIEKYKEDLIKKEMMIVTVGEMKRGKSSMLNALLNEKDIFPVNINVATNAVTILRYGEKEEIIVHFEEYDEETEKFKALTKQIKREEIELYVTEQHNPGNYKGVVALNAKIKSDFLKDGVVFVDTPGLGAINIAHAEVTYNFLGNADLILFVSDVSKGLTDSELKFLSRAYTSCSNILFALTKKDLSPDYEQIVEDNKTKIKNTIPLKEEEINIVPISSVLKTKYLETGEERRYTASGYKKYENLIWTTIAQKKASTTILPFLMSVKEEIDEITENLIMQTQLLEEDAGKIKELVAELENQKKEYEDFTKETNAWKIGMNEFTANLYKKIQNNIESARNEAVEYLELSAAEAGNSFLEKKVYDSITQNINTIISNTVMDIKENIELDVSQKTQELYEELNLDISISRNLFEKANYVPNSEVEVKFPKRTMMDTAVTRGRTVGMTSLAATGIGAAVGIVALSALSIFTGGATLVALPGIIAGSALTGAQAGGVVGTIVGASKAVYDTAVDKKLPSDIPNIVKAINRHITQSLKEASEVLRVLTSETGKEIINSLNNELIAKKESVTENIKQLNENINTTKKDLPQKRAEIQKKLNNIQACQKAFIEKQNIIEKFAVPVNNEKVSSWDKASSSKKEYVKEKTTEEKSQKTVTYGFM